jgi:hypothetical protein
MIMGGNWQFVEDMSYSNAEFPSYGMCQLFKHPTQLMPLPRPSNYYNVCEPIITALITNKCIEEEYTIYFNRAFLQFPLAEKFVKAHNGVHVDVAIPHIAVVYYCNDSDGNTLIFDDRYEEGKTPDYTSLKLNTVVEPKAGRVAIFDGSRYHCSSQPTKNLRCIINFDIVKDVT